MSSFCAFCHESRRIDVVNTSVPRANKMLFNVRVDVTEWRAKSVSNAIKQPPNVRSVSDVFHHAVVDRKYDPVIDDFLDYHLTE